MRQPKPLSTYHSPHQKAILKTLQYQGFSNHCAPYTIASVVNALRQVRLEGANLAEEMNHPVWRGLIPVVRRIPNSATFPWGIADMLRTYGLKARWRLFAKPESMIEGLPQGKIYMPIIGSWKPVWAHVITLVAWDPQLGWGLANTQHPEAFIEWVEDAKFRSMWRKMGNLLVEAWKE